MASGVGKEVIVGAALTPDPRRDDAHGGQGVAEDAFVTPTAACAASERSLVVIQGVRAVAPGKFVKLKTCVTFVGLGLMATMAKFGDWESL